jgi:myo-inositol 2-dehydrogenase / D-chiro-inositol 1-dehydrogenase
MGDMRTLRRSMRMSRGREKFSECHRLLVDLSIRRWGSIYHLFDICRYLFGEVATLKCEARQSISQSEFDDFAVLLTFESGTIGTFVTSAHAGWSYPFQRLEIYGKYSTIAVEDMEKVIYAPGLKRATEESDFKQVPFEEKWGYVEEDRLFVDAILNGTKPPVTADDGYLLSKLLDGIYESAKTGNQVDFRK